MLRIDRLSDLVHRVNETNHKFQNMYGPEEGGYMAAYVQAKEALEQWVLEQVLENSGTSTEAFQLAMPPEAWPAFKKALDQLERDGKIRWDTWMGHNGWLCAHPDVRPLPSDPNFGVCTLCKDDSFPMTYEDGGDNTKLILRNALQAILKCSTLHEVHEQAHAALDATEPL